MGKAKDKRKKKAAKLRLKAARNIARMLATVIVAKMVRDEPSHKPEKAKAAE